MNPIRPVTLLIASLAALVRVSAAEPGVSLDQATQQIQRDTGDRVLSAESRQRRGRQWYRFKVLTPEGRVRQRWVDPGDRRRRR